MNILLINPEFPDTFWSFKYALSFVGKRAAHPPLGLLTVAAMLPPEWSLRLVDTNVRRLKQRDLAWADAVFVSAMGVQRASAQEIISRCKAAGLRTVAGGPLFTGEPDDFDMVDHLVLNEAELTLPGFLRDIMRGSPQHLYASEQFADMHRTPTPRWDLLDLRRYASMSVQFSRGCPFNCDFCNVTALLGHRVRTKTSRQIIAELDGLYALGWRGEVFFVDDNFIGNKQFLKNDLLPALIDWRKDKRGVAFYTEASINLAEDEPLMGLMAEAGFTKVFIGIETPDDTCLAECRKLQNKGRDLLADVRRIQQSGLEVQGGFIVGFDHDQPSIFQRQIDFIQQSGIVTAMVGLLQALPGTRLYERMKKEGRLRGKSSCDNVDGTTNILPTMDLDVLRQGYREILRHIYSPKYFYERVRTHLRTIKVAQVRTPVRISGIYALMRSFWRLGIVGRERFQYWRLLFWTMCRRPRLLPQAVTMAIYGYHFRKMCDRHVI
ncbi:MAG: DUF4070 domain-containing protein [Lentisphaeria bacterium]|nr:DUF4070 domain-containing protein [Lentisphaeria bacterium]